MARNESTPTPDSPAPRRSRKTAGAVIEVSLWTVSIVALSLAGWTWADGALYQMRHQDAVATQAIVWRTPSWAVQEIQEIPEGAPIARIEIPRLGLEPVVVAEGSSTEVLRRAVGHLPSSALPAEEGNVVLAGHRDTFFRPLEGVRVGDVIVLEVGEGRKDYYEVEWTEIVEPTAVRVMEETGYPALTLITCYPFRFVGNAPQRFIVRARRLASPGEEV